MSAVRKRLIPVGAVLAAGLTGGGLGQMAAEVPIPEPERIEVEVQVPATVDHESIRSGVDQAIETALEARFQQAAAELVKTAKEAKPRVVVREVIDETVRDAWNRAYEAAPNRTRAVMLGKIADTTSPDGFARALESLVAAHARHSRDRVTDDRPTALEQYRAATSSGG